MDMKMEINKADVTNLLKLFDASLVRKAIRSGLDRTATWGKNYLSDLVAQNYNVKSSEVRKVMKVSRTTQSLLSSSITTASRSLSLIDYFNAIQDSVGVSATISPGWIKRTPHAFINKASFKKKSGKMGSKRVVMLRVGRSRYPTTGKAGWGPPIQVLLGRSRVLKPAELKMLDHLYKELEEQIAKRTQQSAPLSEIE